VACTAMHLLIAEKYCKNNNITNTKAFIHGAYLPDVAEDKITSHFGIKKNYTSLKDMLDSKVDLTKCVNALDFEKEQDIGIFLHLVTDYLYYNYLYECCIAKKLDPNTVLSSLKNDANLITRYIMLQYKPQVPTAISHLVEYKKTDQKLQLFSNFGKVEEFINLVAKLNLIEIKTQIYTSSNLSFKTKLFDALER
jgi:hypothetical protein